LTHQISNEPPQLIIDDGTCIGHFCHVTCVNKVYIGKNVLTADRLYISDNLHGYENVNIPIMHQKVIFKGEASIGDDSWIGENVSIIGCKIGKHCVIGANAVVTKDIPDYSVATGIPARVIKKYNPQTQNWEKVKD
jgi:Acetyltransferase (isoleucine patch superfamily)